MSNEKSEEVIRDSIIQFPQQYIEKAHLYIVLSMFRSFVEQGLLTEDEYSVIASEGKKRLEKQ